jgi:23S rRNA (cytosine1962-C5)-methyltransferase
MSAGDAVVVESAAGEALGLATVSPANLICARLLSRDPECQLDSAFFEQRVTAALSLREQQFDEPYYRLIYGEADGLPGMVIDRFGDILSVQLATAGMERRRQEILAALVSLLKPAGIALKNDGAARQAEGLDSYVEVAYGEVPEFVKLRENGVNFEVSVLSGQKTGWFYDHRDSRAQLLPWCNGARVLDVFSYVGGWGVQAAAAGAAEVLCIDSSAAALQMVERNAALNGSVGRVSTLQGQAEAGLRQLAKEGRRFDIVVLDPPAFIKRRKDSGAGQAAYRKLNQLAMALLPAGGLLVSASCSMHLPRATLVDIVGRAAARAGRRGVIIAQGGQGRDHPIVPVIPETEYLKTLFVKLPGD